MVESSQAPYKNHISYAHDGDDFIREAKRYGHGFVAKSRLNSDLVPALYAAIEYNFLLSALFR
jgi:hypothetical protein